MWRGLPAGRPRPRSGGPCNPRGARAGIWHGWQRFIPLLCGLFVFFVFIPITFTQPDLFLWPVAGWSACFVPLGIALYQQRPVRAYATLATAPA